jgi:hypothetical protein
VNEQALNPYFIQAEVDYRRERATAAARHADRSRQSQRRRLLRRSGAR